MDKIKMVKAKIRSSDRNATIYFDTIEQALANFDADLTQNDEEDNPQVGDKIVIELTIVEMTKKQIEALEEFDGY